MDTYEILYIAQYESNGNKGLNLTNGGKGISGATFKRKPKSRTNSLVGIPKSDEHKKKISDKLKGRKLSQEHKNNLSKARMKCFS